MRRSRATGPVVRGLGNSRRVNISGQLPILMQEFSSPHDPGVFAPPVIDWQSVRKMEEYQAAEDERRRAIDQLSILGQAQDLFDKAPTAGMRSTLDELAGQFGLPAMTSGMASELENRRAATERMIQESSQPMISSAMNDEARKAAQEKVAQQILLLKLGGSTFGGLQAAHDALMKMGSGKETLDPYTRTMEQIRATAEGRQKYAPLLNLPFSQRQDIRRVTARQIAHEAAAGAVAGRTDQYLKDLPKVTAVQEARAGASAKGRAMNTPVRGVSSELVERTLATMIINGATIGPDEGYEEGTLIQNIPQAEQRQVVWKLLQQGHERAKAQNRSDLQEQFGPQTGGPSGGSSDVNQLLDIFRGMK